MATEREQAAALREDRQDLLQVVRLRFGEIEPAVAERVEAIEDAGLLQHLILLAANEPYERLLRELGIGARAL